MGLAHQSIATIKAPQFINLQPLDINPLMSSCEIKVLYIGENRNRSFISKEVATEMAKTLRGAPIVGYYKEQKQDFMDHGQQMILDGQGIRFNCLTKPYGFVAPDAKVWFKDFEDYDESGNSIVRTYLMTTGYLWTGQFKEVESVFEDNGKPHSMELDEKSVQGYWSKEINNNFEFFIINDAIFSKLCILGDEVEPCFEGSGVTPPDISTSFTLDKEFTNTLFKMMRQLTEALEGGKQMTKENELNVTEQKIQDKSNEFTSKENNITIEDESVTTSDFVKKEEDEEQKKTSEEQPEKEEQNNSDEGSEGKDQEEEKKKKYTLLEEEYNKLQTEFSILETEVKELREFKLNIENKEKDELINQFYMLSDEDKKDVIDNKSNYSLDQIKAKLAVICFEKKINFTEQETSNDLAQQQQVITTFAVDSYDSTPDWVKAVESNMNNNI